MKIYKLQQKYLFISLPNTTSFFIRLRQTKSVWLFNCSEGCQHILAKHKVKISQIKKIIITHNNIDNISGLLGLLSSISLGTATSRLDIYAPKSLLKHIFLCRKYSQTNFRYLLYFHTIVDNFIVNEYDLTVYSQHNEFNFYSSNYIILSFETSGRFNSINAFSYQIPPGPLYRNFKLGMNFIVPDGFIPSNQNFIYGYCLGSKLIFMPRLIKYKNQYLRGTNALIVYQ